MSDCIEWSGKHWNTGYPYMMGGEPGKRRMIAVHRWTWEQANGPIPPGGVIMHLCDNRGCINIEHLRLGTFADNTADMVSKGRGLNQQKTHCPNGHEYDKVVHRLTGPRAGKVSRYCSICANARRRAAWAAGRRRS